LVLVFTLASWFTGDHYYRVESWALYVADGIKVISMDGMCSLVIFVRRCGWLGFLFGRVTSWLRQVLLGKTYLSCGVGSKGGW